MNYIEQLHWRYATKHFDASKTIDTETWDKIEESLILTPSSFGLQPWKFIVITDPEIKAKLKQHAWGQPQVTDCSHYVIFCATECISQKDTDAFLDDTVATRGGTREDLKPYQDMMEGFLSQMSDTDKFNWAKNQSYIALGQLMATAAALEIDACPMEGISPNEFDNLIGITGYKTVVACALGYRHEEDKYAQLAKVRFSKDALIVHH